MIKRLYIMVCDDPLCGQETLAYSSKENLIAGITNKGWILRSTKCFCPNCVSKHPPSKRGRKPKPKEELISWEAPESNIWTPGE